jgi:FAD/FMN-containing dehydrogenase
MPNILTKIKDITTFGAFASKEQNPTQSKGWLSKGSYLSYLLVSNLALLVKKDWQQFKLWYQHGHKSHQQKVSELQQDYVTKLQSLSAGEHLGSVKDSTHQFADKVYQPKARLDTRHFNRAYIDPEGQFVDVEANMTFGDLITFLNKAGYRIPLVPEFLEITVGGAFIGVAIESSGHQFGLFHETVLQAEILQPNGELLTASVKQNEDIFNVMPNSNGTLGRALNIRIPLIPLKSAHPDKTCHPYLDKERRDDYLAQPEKPWLNPKPDEVKLTKYHPTEHVHLKYLRFSNQQQALEEFWRLTEAQQVDFIEAVATSATDIVIITGEVVATVEDIPADKRHNYLTKDVFWDHVKDPQRQDNYVPLIDYFSRWHQTVFWNTQDLGAPTEILNSWLFRSLFQRRLGTSFLKQLEHSHNQWLDFSGEKKPGAESPQETIVQDLGIPKKYLPDFFKWYDDTIGHYPIWLCPLAPADGRFPLFTHKAEGFSLDFGIFNGKSMPQHPSDPAYYNKLIEAWLLEHGGIKGFYSKNCWSKEAFQQVYNGETYDRMKALLDPEGKCPDLYQKMVASQQGAHSNQKPHNIKFPFSFESYQLWLQCLATSVGACLITCIFMSVPVSQMFVLGSAIAFSGQQLSTFFGQMAPQHGYDSTQVTLGLSGLNCSFIFAATLTLMTQFALSPHLLSLALVSLVASGKGINLLLADKAEPEPPLAQQSC